MNNENEMQVGSSESEGKDLRWKYAHLPNDKEFNTFFSISKDFNIIACIFCTRNQVRYL